jgi:adrenodoxin-NADP+ reductase
VQSTVFARTALASTFDPTSGVEVTGETTTIPSSTVFRSIGYKSIPLDGFSEASIPFDARLGIVQNDGLGRVLRAVTEDSQGGVPTAKPFPGLYCSGWVKRGPTGVIASTMDDAFSTGDSIIRDWLSGAPFLGDATSSKRYGWERVKAESGPLTSRVVDWRDWRQIDNAERQRGQTAGKEREKFLSIPEMLAMLG